jgi:uncharacterized membrane protein YdjX (TVP38/TMEM64 family)
LKDGVEALQAWIEDHGAAGIAVFVLAYVGATLLLVPTWIFTLAAGALFGVGWGFLVVMASALSSATTAFLLARHVLRDRLRRRFAHHEVLQAVDKSVRKEGWKVVVLLRLSPIVPFGIQGYFFGVTSVRLAHFAAATAIGIVPATLVYLVLGATSRDALGEGGGAKWALLGAGLVATFLATWLVGRATRKRLALE